MKELLNKLIEKGWKPFGDNAIKFDYDGMKTRGGYGAITYLYRDSYIDDYGDEVEYEEWKHQFNNRELVSKESGLWQFVCENNLNYSEDDSIYNVWLKHYAEDDHESPYTYASPVWYIIESSLKDESELEDFLLQNIKVDEKDNM